MATRKEVEAQGTAGMDDRRNDGRGAWMASEGAGHGSGPMPIAIESPALDSSFEFSLADGCLMTDRNSRVSNYQYDFHNRLKKETWVGSSPLREINYNYLVTGELHSVGDMDHTYAKAYDPVGRLKTVTQTLTGITSNVEFTYERNLLGQRLLRDAKIGGVADARVAWGYDDLDRLISIAQGDSPLSRNTSWPIKQRPIFRWHLTMTITVV